MKNDFLFDDYKISYNKKLLDIAFVHKYLSENAYWCLGIPFEIVDKSIANSICFGIYHQDNQIGFARVITDKATFGYLADVFIIEAYRGKGLSLRLVDFILAHPDLQTLRGFLLGTRDAHGLYEKFGWKKLGDELKDRFMRKTIAKPYTEI